MTWEDGEPTIGTVFTPKLESLLGPARRRDEPVDAQHEAIAASLQAVFEDAAMHVLRHVQKRDRQHAAVPRRRLRDEQRRQRQDPRARRGFRDVFIQPAAGDNGTALGAAFYAWHQLAGQPRSFVMEHGYWGPSFDDGAIVAALDAQQAVDRRAGLRPPRLDRRGRARRLDRRADRATAASSAGFRAGWSGAPRALGNRSILADPAPRRHARHHQHADQVPRAVPPVRAVGARGGARRVLRRRRARSVHAAGVSGPARQARGRPGDHARRRLGPAADGEPALEPALLRPDPARSRGSPACRCCSTRRSTRTSRSC